MRLHDGWFGWIIQDADKPVHGVAVVVLHLKGKEVDGSTGVGEEGMGAGRQVCDGQRAHRFVLHTSTRIPSLVTISLCLEVFFAF